MATRNRPQVNRRRGLLRAALTVVILIVLLIVGLMIASSLTAPKAQAPIVPPTPARAVPPTVRSTPAKTGTPSARAHATGTPTKKKKLGLASVGDKRTSIAMERSGASLFAPSLREPGLRSDLVASPNGRLVASFRGRGDAYSGRTLVVRSIGTGRARVLARADPYVLPVWSPNSQSLLFVRVRTTAASPGASWSLYAYDLVHSRSRLLARRTGLDLEPVGWTGTGVLYTVANETDTSLYSIMRGRSTLETVLLPQAITSLRFSPNGRYIALVAPTNCSTCTLDIYDLATMTMWIGPTGLVDERSFGWSYDSRYVVGSFGHVIEAIDASSHSVSTFGDIAALAGPWPPSLRIGVSSSTITIRDLATTRLLRAESAGAPH